MIKLAAFQASGDARMKLHLADERFSRVGGISCQ